MRKSPDIWSRWSVSGGNGLHMMQLRIALQGARLLKVG
jgi:16S rRNA C967 or C1407 C5-methylase (RsmB/RsmF family)